MDNIDRFDSSVKLRVISYGGGVQSTAMCVLAAQGKLDDIMGGPIDAALFANTGDDTEYPPTLDFVRNIMIPWGAARGLKILELHRFVNGVPTTIYKDLVDMNVRSIDIPVRMKNGSFGNRKCTSKFKIEVVHQWLRANGVDSTNFGSRNGKSKLDDDQVGLIRSLNEQGLSCRKIAETTGIPRSTVGDVVSGKSWRKPSYAVTAIGISVDEIHRLNRRRHNYNIELDVYPLIELGLDRDDCKQIIADAGLPVPPRSACFFCPFRGMKSWNDLYENDPDLFERSVELEKTINKKRFMLGKDEVFLTSKGKSLPEAIGEYRQNVSNSIESFNDGKCDEGYCWT